MDSNTEYMLKMILAIGALGIGIPIVFAVTGYLLGKFFTYGALRARQLFDDEVKHE